MSDDLRDDEAPLDWAERMLAVGALPAFVPVHVDGEPGIGWAAYESEWLAKVGGSADGNVRASLAIVFCRRLHREACAVGADV